VDRIGLDTEGTPPDTIHITLTHEDEFYFRPGSPNMNIAASMMLVKLGNPDTTTKNNVILGMQISPSNMANRYLVRYGFAYEMPPGKAKTFTTTFPDTIMAGENPAAQDNVIPGSIRIGDQPIDQFKGADVAQVRGSVGDMVKAHWDAFDASGVKVIGSVDLIQVLDRAGRALRGEPMVPPTWWTVAEVLKAYRGSELSQERYRQQVKAALHSLIR
jgi:hypothetical protein